MEHASVVDPAAVWFADALITVKLDSGSTQGRIGAVEARLRKGYGPPLHTHFAEDEVFYVLEGRVRCRTGDRDFVVEAGDMDFRPRGEAHAFRVESETARALIIYTPAGFEEFYVAGGSAAYGTTEPPPQTSYTEEEAQAAAERFGYQVVGPRLE